MTVLETSFVAFRLNPYFNNFNKRLVSTPKIYFYDTGLAAYLLDLKNEKDIDLHFSKGSLFENLVIVELLKNKLNTGKRPQFYFWRDAAQHEVDLLIQEGPHLKAIEIKAGKTIQPDYFKHLKYLKSINPDTKLNVIYGGDSEQKRTDIDVYGFGQVDKLF